MFAGIRGRRKKGGSKGLTWGRFSKNRSFYYYVCFGLVGGLVRLDWIRELGVDLVVRWIG